jgi:hypothetical protein
MSVSFVQKAIVGTRLKIRDLKTVTSEAEYEYQPRYDVKTGQKISEVRVLVKEEQSIYTYKNLSDKCIHELASLIEEAYKLSAYVSDEDLYIGMSVGGRIDYANTRLIMKEMSQSELSDMFSYVGKTIPNPSLCFFTDVG